MISLSDFDDVLRLTPCSTEPAATPHTSHPQMGRQEISHSSPRHVYGGGGELKSITRRITIPWAWGLRCGTPGAGQWARWGPRVLGLETVVPRVSIGAV
ncbi:hypothetical protein E2562_036669 [Oryza meyeriana var. granulata]|uniref:Uncharacterized protein n=1 Tax=Oryza meyeriana var. granulata TaxID=110450 RepID=A0A6G1FGH2_9ORYZ|nr:hypothetical protein E2562_036669 [Oryza meyeriana var. granulata]